VGYLKTKQLRVSSKQNNYGLALYPNGGFSVEGLDYKYGAILKPLLCTANSFIFSYPHT
jgi:hypothetical protein